MIDRPNQTGHEDEERWITTVEELAAYIDENRKLATSLVHEIADELVTDGSHQIEEILEKGYEDSYYITINDMCLTPKRERHNPAERIRGIIRRYTVCSVPPFTTGETMVREH